MSNKSRRRPSSRTGALAQILAEEHGTDNRGTANDQASLEAPPAARPAQPASRYYPTKGRARIPPQVCRLWKYADRPEDEAQHAGAIAESFAEDGQIAAAIVRCVRDSKHPDIRYEIISGQVRWRAALAAGTDLEVDIRDLDDKAAFRLMVRENELRRGLSDYATALRLRRALADGIYADRTTLAHDMRLSATQLSYYLGFAELPHEVVSRFKDITRIPVRLGYVVNRAIQQGFGDQVLAHLADIEGGAIARDQIPAIWMDEEHALRPARTPRSRNPSRAVRYVRRDGTPLFSLRKGGESGPVLRFSKGVSHVLDDAFWNAIQAQIEERLRQAQDFSTEK